MICTLTNRGLVRRVVISGCSGGGKSTLIEEMQRRGYPAMPEAGRQVVNEQLASGGDGLPWADARKFTQLCVERCVAQHRVAGSIDAPFVLFDRSMIDNLAGLEALDGALSEALQKIRADHRYDSTVYLVPPWPEIYRVDNERRHEFSDEEYWRLRSAYPALGYEVVDIPKIPVSERADWLCERLIGRL